MPSIPGASSLTVPAEGSVGLSSHLMMPWEDWLESNFNLGKECYVILLLNARCSTV